MKEVLQRIKEYITLGINCDRNPNLRRCPTCKRFMEIWIDTKGKCVCKCIKCKYEEDAL